MPSLLSRTRLLSAGLLAAAALLAGATAAQANVGILPPANPAANCDATGVGIQFTLQNLNACRAKEHVGPMVLPGNWASLTGAEQLFVLLNLERVNRGLAPIVGLSSSLNQLAAQGAAAGTDPSFPGGGFIGGGGVWFGGQSALAADYAWMYDDGPNGFDVNVDCPHGGSSDCWLHRDIVLWQGTGGPLVGGGGVDGQSFSFEVLSGYSTSGMVFTWAHELRYFAQNPTVEPLNPLAKPAKSTNTRPVRHRRRKRHHRHGGGGNSGITITIG